MVILVLQVTLHAFSCVYRNAGIATGFAPAMPTAIYTLERAEGDTISVAIATRVPPARDLGEVVPKTLSADEPKVSALVDELHGLLKELPTDRDDLANISLDVGIEWASDDLQWRNTAPTGRGDRNPSDGLVGSEEKKKFKRAVEIVDELIAMAEQ